MHRGDVPAHGQPDKYATDLFTDEALKIIQGHEPSRPLYLQISHLAAHGPLEDPQDYTYDQRFIHIRDPERRKYASTYVQRSRYKSISIIQTNQIIKIEEYLEFIINTISARELEESCILRKNLMYN